MIFAFVTGRLITHLARHRLENGSTLGILEQLMGSQTLGSAYSTHIQLRIVNPVGICLLGIWLLSPIGAQSLLRILHQATRSIHTTVTHFDHLKQGDSYATNPAGSYVGSLLASSAVKDGPEDLWGNVKIPFLQADAGHKDGNWRAVNKVDEGPVYSGLVGIPVTGVPFGNSTFSI